MTPRNYEKAGGSQENDTQSKSGLNWFFLMKWNKAQNSNLVSCMSNEMQIKMNLDIIENNWEGRQAPMKPVLNGSRQMY